MWYSESEDSRVEGIMEELSKQNNFSKDLTVRLKNFTNASSSFFFLKTTSRLLKY